MCKCARAATGHGRLGSMRRVRRRYVESKRNPDAGRTNVNVRCWTSCAIPRDQGRRPARPCRRSSESQQFVMGPPVRSSRPPWPGFAHAQHGIACASGTDALLLPLKALGSHRGRGHHDALHGFSPRPGRIHNAGGTHVFVDIEPGTFNIDPAAVEAASHPARVHRAGHLYVRWPRWSVCWRSRRALGLKLVRTQPRRSARAARSTGMANGGELRWPRLLLFSEQELGAWGDGGMMVTSDDALGERLASCGCTAARAVPSR